MALYDYNNYWPPLNHAQDQEHLNPGDLPDSIINTIDDIATSVTENLLSTTPDGGNKTVGDILSIDFNSMANNISTFANNSTSTFNDTYSTPFSLVTDVLSTFTDNVSVLDHTTVVNNVNDNASEIISTVSDMNSTSVAENLLSTTLDGGSRIVSDILSTDFTSVTTISDAVINDTYSTASTLVTNALSAFTDNVGVLDLNSSTDTTKISNTAGKIVSTISNILSTSVASVTESHELSGSANISSSSITENDSLNVSNTVANIFQSILSTTQEIPPPVTNSLSAITTENIYEVETDFSSATSSSSMQNILFNNTSTVENDLYSVSETVTSIASAITENLPTHNVLSTVTDSVMNTDTTSATENSVSTTLNDIISDVISTNMPPITESLTTTMTGTSNSAVIELSSSDSFSATDHFFTTNVKNITSTVTDRYTTFTSPQNSTSAVYGSSAVFSETENLVSTTASDTFDISFTTNETNMLENVTSKMYGVFATDDPSEINAGSYSTTTGRTVGLIEDNDMVLYVVLGVIMSFLIIVSVTGYLYFRKYRKGFRKYDYYTTQVSDFDQPEENLPLETCYVHNKL